MYIYLAHTKYFTQCKLPNFSGVCSTQVMVQRPSKTMFCVVYKVLRTSQVNHSAKYFINPQTRFKLVHKLAERITKYVVLLGPKEV